MRRLGGAGTGAAVPLLAAAPPAAEPDDAIARVRLCGAGGTARRARGRGHEHSKARKASVNRGVKGRLNDTVVPWSNRARRGEG